ncbi:MAG: exodeoxyribonuclease V subunit gamma [Spirochaetes bacterium]|nr:exodeoxyribonuclease V subunit gamma [Spirochaetota bacterium]
MNLDYTAYFSNSLKKLVPLYIKSSASAKLFDNNTIVIIQNKNMEEWLRFEIASLTGLCSGINFMFQDNALRNILEKFPGVPEIIEKKSIVYLDDLKIIIYRQLKLIFSQIKNYPDFQIIKKYIDESGEEKDFGVNQRDPERLQKSDYDNLSYLQSERLFSLADSIAGLFYYYGFNCPEMVATWEAGKSFIENSDFDYALHHEKWQAELWRIIFSKTSPYLHLGQLITDILENRFKAPQLNSNIVIFGSSFLSEQAVNFFCYLSENCGVCVNHFILSPSPVYSNSAFPDDSASGLVAVEKWASIVKGLANILCRKKVAIKEYYESLAANTILEKLKAAIFNNEIMPVNDDEGCFKDNSMVIISASGKKREIEIIKNKIIQLVSEKGIKFHEIGVAAPDINEYIPFIESIFPSDNELLDIPYNIMDIDIGRESSYVKTFLDLTELCGSRFSRKDLFKIFSSQCFMERYGVTRKDIDEWLSICDALSIKWGVDYRHRNDVLSYEDNSGTWDCGFQRIIAGLVFDEREGEVSFPGNKKILPYALSGNNEEKKISIMFAVVESLYNDLYYIKKSKMKLSEWSSFFEKIMDKYLTPIKGTDDEKSRSFLKNIFRHINNLKAVSLISSENIGEVSKVSGKERIEAFEEVLDFNLEDGNHLKDANADADAVEFPVFKALLDEYSKSGGHYKGRYLSTGVCFSSIKPLRAIPFSAIFVIGMDIDVFPGKEKPLSYDLRNVTEKSIDLSKQNSDSFAFLETIISAEKYLGILYNGTDPVTGESREPSVVVSDIGDILGKNIVQEITMSHPLFPYNPAYYMKDSKYGISYDIKNYDPAVSFYKDKKESPFIPLFGKNNYESEKSSREIPVLIRDVLMFLKTPLSYFLRSELSIYENSLELAENDVNENLGIDYLEQLHIVEDLGKITGDFDCDFFVDSIYKRKILESRVADIPAVKKEYEMLKPRICDLYNNLHRNRYFDSDLVNVIFGDNSAAQASNEIAAKSVVFDGRKFGKLEISGLVKGLRAKREKDQFDFHAIISGKNYIKNIIPHFFCYLLFKTSNYDFCNSYTIYDNLGEKIFTFSDSAESSKIDIKVSTASIADAYILNLQTPYVVDIGCIEFGIKEFKKGKNIDEVISSMKKYYDYYNFADLKYLKGFNSVDVRFDDEIFKKLMENFFFHLNF